MNLNKKINFSKIIKKNKNSFKNSLLFEQKKQ